LQSEGCTEPKLKPKLLVTPCIPLHYSKPKKSQTMKKSLLILTAFSASVFFVSCTKESSQPVTSGNIQGTWSFQSMDITSTSTQEYTESGITSKTVTTSDYTTGDNTGTIVIDGSTMTSSNLSYSVNTIAHASIFSNGVLLTTQDIPFNFTAPASSGNATYTMVGADSIHFDGGSIFMSDMITDITPSGAKLSMEGDVLSMTQYVNQTVTKLIYGLPVTVTTDAKAVVKLKKQ